MNNAYLYYYGHTENKLVDIVKYALYFAYNEADIQFDTFNCLNIMDNASFTEELKFNLGSGVLNYYMYNY
jgi:glycylpeptide N-tetradecanoyltransferase